MILLGQVELEALFDWAIRISVPILIAVLTGVAKVIWSINNEMKGKATKEEVNELRTHVASNTADTAVLKSLQVETGRRLERMDEKLDRLLERE